MKKILVILAFIGLSSCQEQRTSQKSVEEQTEPSEVTRVENPEEARLKRYLTFKSYFKKEIKLLSLNTNKKTNNVNFYHQKNVCLSW